MPLLALGLTILSILIPIAIALLIGGTKALVLGIIHLDFVIAAIGAWWLAHVVLGLHTVFVILVVCAALAGWTALYRSKIYDVAAFRIFVSSMTAVFVAYAIDRIIFIIQVVRLGIADTDAADAYFHFLYYDAGNPFGWNIYAFESAMAAYNPGLDVGLFAGLSGLFAIIWDHLLRNIFTTPGAIFLSTPGYDAIWRTFIACLVAGLIVFVRLRNVGGGDG